MSRKVLRLLGALAIFVAGPLYAQSPTPEGTVITNNVSVTYTDANGTTYSAATSSVQVTVGFMGGVDVSSPASVSPASPSTGNELLFTITNIGNGADSVNVNVTTQTGVSITGYKIGSTTYANLTELNAALAATSVAGITGSVQVTVVYTVASLLGGETRPITLTATSRRDGTKSDASTTNVNPPVAGGMTISANVASASRLPTGNAGAYSAVFTITNGANASRTIDLTGSTTGTGITITSVNGGNASITLGANATGTVTVQYTVGPTSIAAGTVGAVVLAGAAQDNPTVVTGSSTHTVTVIRAALSLTKEVFRDNQSTPITASDRVLPGEDVWYKLTITNTGAAAAHTLALTDQLPAEVTYVSHSAPAAWTVTYNAANTTVSANLTGTLASLASNVIWVRATIK